MKKHSWKSVLASGAMIGMLALTACGGGSANSTNNNGNASKPQEPAPKAAEPVKKSDFPNKPVTIIVPHAAGGGTDVISRQLAKAAEKHLGQSIVVVNKTGGGGSVGMTEGANVKPDGYTTTMLTVELTMIHHLGQTKINYTQFKPVAQFNEEPPALSVRANDTRFNSAKDFIEYAKKHPEEVKIGNSGTGAIWHINAASIEKTAGVKFNHVPFDGSAPALVSLMGGHIDAVLVSPPEVKPHVDSGKVKTLAILDSKEAAVFPGIKTFEAETGLKPQYFNVWRGIGVPKDTPDDVVQILAEAFKKGAAEKEFVDFMNGRGHGLVQKDGPAFGQLMKESDEKFGKSFKELGITQ